MVSTVRLFGPGKWREMMAAAQRNVDCYQAASTAISLARGKISRGGGTAIPLLARTIQLNPRDPHARDRYWRTAFALPVDRTLR